MHVLLTSLPFDKHEEQMLEEAQVAQLGILHYMQILLKIMVPLKQLAHRLELLQTRQF
jgi:hypothetical protein